jgi:hypothetical protein
MPLVSGFGGLVSENPATGGGGGGATIAATTDIIIGDGAGNGTTGAGNITSASATALTVGANGATNPALQVDASTASSATGVSIKSAAAGNSVRIEAISSAANEALICSGKGSGAFIGTSNNFVQFQVNGTTIFSGSQSQCAFATPTRAFTSNTGLDFTFAASTNAPISTEVLGFNFNASATQTHQTGAITTQRDIRFRTSTHAFNGASTISDVYGVSIDGAPIAGTNATFTRSTTLFLGANPVGAGTATSYGLWAKPNTGATANNAARFDGAIDLNGAGVGTSGQVLTSGGVGAAPTWTTPGGGGATTFTEVEKDLGTVPRLAGKFTITGLSGLTIGKPVIISQAVGPYTGKGTLADESEMDGLIVKAVVTAVDVITAYWNAMTRVKGNVKFNYLVGA